MGHRWYSLRIVAASCFVLFAGDLAHAQKKPQGAAAPKNAPAAANAGKTKKPAAGTPASPEIATIKVCVRPEGIDKKASKWTFGQGFKPVDNDVERTAKLFGNRIYVFDEKAPNTSPRSMPAPHNEKKCPNDKGEKDAAPAPKSGGFLPASGSAFPSARILESSGPLLGSGSLGSSGTGNSSKTLVDEFVKKAQAYPEGNSDEEKQAADFAARLHEALTTNKKMAEVTVETLSPDAAGILAGAFGTSLAAAMAQQPVIGPLNVLQKMVPSGKTPAWKVFPLMGKDVMDGWKLDSPDTVPAVILPLPEYEQRAKSNAELIKNPLPPDILWDRYKQAYGDKPDWLASIKPYF